VGRFGDLVELNLPTVPSWLIPEAARAQQTAFGLHKGRQTNPS